MTQLRTTPSEENYLEWIYRMSQKSPVRPAQLAEKIGVSRPSASRAVTALKKKGLLTHEPYKAIRLTEAGQVLGEAIVRRDECLTSLLVEVLGMSPGDADPEVHRLEHVLSEAVLARLEVLVAFSLSSDAWIKRLRHRVEVAVEERDRPGQVRAGVSDIHPGHPCEKQPRTQKR